MDISDFEKMNATPAQQAINEARIAAILHRQARIAAICEHGHIIALMDYYAVSFEKATQIYAFLCEEFYSRGRKVPATIVMPSGWPNHQRHLSDRDMLERDLARAKLLDGARKKARKPNGK